MSDLAFSTLTQLAQGLQQKKYSSEEITREYLGRIKKADGKLHAYVSVNEESALTQARAADLRRASGYSLSVVDGLPLAVKDLCEIEGQITTGGSQDWINRRSPTTCTAVERLMRAGMVMLGKVHMVEFAFGGWGTNPVMGTPWNPWDLKTHRVPGGSSSGSGVAVAAGLAPAALGSDTGGSVRIPAALNGITGQKTTRGLISLHGALALSGTLDSIGPMTRDVQDSAILTGLMAGEDPLDPTSCNRPMFHWKAPAAGPKPLAGFRIAMFPAEHYPIALGKDVIKMLDDTRRVLVELGAQIVEKPFPFDFNDMMLRNGQIIASEAYAIHRAYIDDAARPFGEFVRKRVQSGRNISSADYIDAIADHRRTIAAWTDWMSNVDALLSPSAPIGACPLTEVDESKTPMAAFTRAGNYMGCSGMSLPAGFADNGMPLGAQLLGKPFDDGTLVTIGMAFQAATSWHLKRPDLSSLGI
ncbi:amidase [Zwartia vadi]|uniref:amidase n=1 Tax=Zwartia vadi TaxID=3058168 RepID=UPI0025B5CCF1|nr:amidase [Zwartia vadi]MDN3988201.1 amidase [Zwartia vadi]